ncbi:MAG: DUF1997 domain-containing protein [Pleurocapsa minor HA4230-MV1]|jgi:hypothetical protein|nr:DUF1997 domain-containing protein [Pleurocapsa minor HA4230-MV1]
MQSKFINHSQNTFLEISSSDSMQLTYTDSIEQQRTFAFKVSFNGRMDMYSDLDTVAKYLDAHEGWFCRCAQPMKVEPVADNGYILTVGKFGSFGYEVEPKIAVVLNPPVDRVYLMQTIPLPDCDEAYEVNYRAKMKLQEVAVDACQTSSKGLFNQQTNIPQLITEVSWGLDLQVKVEFPQFISKLSPNLIQATGDRLLAQIVRQISPRLTYKVQQDFHNSHSLPMPPKSSRQLHKVTHPQQYAV